MTRVTLEAPGGVRSELRLEPLPVPGGLGAIGSQGVVYAVSGRPGLAVKIMHAGFRAAIGRRLDAMLAAPFRWTVRDGLIRATWPTARVSSGGQIIGYAMDRLSPAHRPLEPGLALAPDWSWHLDLATDLTRTVAAAAEQGHVIGDLAPENIFVTPNAQATLVDTDGWQIRDRRGGAVLPCAFSRPEYTAPEHLADPVDQRIRRPEADLWALGTVVTQILTGGIHPFAGVAADTTGPIDASANILAGRCWLLGADVKMPRGTPPSALLGGPLRRLAERCFGAGHAVPRLRPAAHEWLAALIATRAALAHCPAGPRHRYPRELGRCPWCGAVS